MTNPVIDFINNIRYSDEKAQGMESLSQALENPTAQNLRHFDAWLFLHASYDEYQRLRTLVPGVNETRMIKKGGA